MPTREEDQTTEPPVTAVKTPQTAITVQAEQVSEESATTVETAFVGKVSGTETAVETDETTEAESEVVIEEPEVFTEEKTPTAQETITEECTEIIEDLVTTGPVEDYIGEGEDRPGDGKRF